MTDADDLARLCDDLESHAEYCDWDDGPMLREAAATLRRLQAALDVVKLNLNGIIANEQQMRAELQATLDTVIAERDNLRTLTTIVPAKPGHRIVLDSCSPFQWHYEPVDPPG